MSALDTEGQSQRQSLVRYTPNQETIVCLQFVLLYLQIRRICLCNSPHAWFRLRVRHTLTVLWLYE